MPATPAAPAPSASGLPDSPPRPRATAAATARHPRAARAAPYTTHRRSASRQPPPAAGGSPSTPPTLVMRPFRQSTGDIRAFLREQHKPPATGQPGKGGSSKEDRPPPPPGVPTRSSRGMRRTLTSNPVVGGLGETAFEVPKAPAADASPTQAQHAARPAQSGVPTRRKTFPRHRMASRRHRSTPANGLRLTRSGDLLVGAGPVALSAPNRDAPSEQVADQTAVEPVASDQTPAQPADINAITAGPVSANQAATGPEAAGQAAPEPASANEIIDESAPPRKGLPKSAPRDCAGGVNKPSPPQVQIVEPTKEGLIGKETATLPLQKIDDRMQRYQSARPARATNSLRRTLTESPLLPREMSQEALGTTGHSLETSGPGAANQVPEASPDLMLAPPTLRRVSTRAPAHRSLARSGPMRSNSAYKRNLYATVQPGSLGKLDKLEEQLPKKETAPLPPRGEIVKDYHNNYRTVRTPKHAGQNDAVDATATPQDDPSQANPAATLTRHPTVSYLAPSAFIAQNPSFSRNVLVRSVSQQLPSNRRPSSRRMDAGAPTRSAAQKLLAKTPDTPQDSLTPPPVNPPKLKQQSPSSIQPRSQSPSPLTPSTPPAPLGPDKVEKEEDCPPVPDRLYHELWTKDILEVPHKAIRAELGDLDAIFDVVRAKKGIVDRKEVALLQDWWKVFVSFMEFYWEVEEQVLEALISLDRLTYYERSEARKTVGDARAQREALRRNLSSIDKGLVLCKRPSDIQATHRDLKKQLEDTVRIFETYSGADHLGKLHSYLNLANSRTNWVKIQTRIVRVCLRSRGFKSNIVILTNYMDEEEVAEWKSKVLREEFSQVFDKYEQRYREGRAKTLSLFQLSLLLTQN